MLHAELLPDKGILIVTPAGPLEKADFDRLAREVDPCIESRGKLQGVMIYTPSFPGWSDFGALVAHLKFIRDHHRQVLRVAAVTESAVLSILPLVAGHFVQAQVRHFDYADKDRALAWLTGTGLRIEVLEDRTAAAKQAAAYIAGEARLAVAARGRFILALSGGTTPLEMLRLLSDHGVPWKEVQVVQVDERLAPAEDPDRNFLYLKETFLDHVPLTPGQIHAMPMEEEDLDTAAVHYAKTLREIAGDPPVLDLVHLGMGPDGHTASLVPGDPVLEVIDRDVAPTGVYQGRRRLTLTYPIINRARRILWLVTGRDKAPMLARLNDGDPSIPAGRISRERALVMADRAAAAKLE